MTSVSPPLTQIYAASKDPSPQSKVNAGNLDSQTLSIIAYVNRLNLAVSQFLRDDNTPNDASVPLRALTADVQAMLGSFAGWKPRPGVACATTGSNITLSGEQTLDGVTTNFSRVLVKDQSNPAQNAIYISNPGAWTLAPEAPIGTDTGYNIVTVLGGTQALTSWIDSDPPGSAIIGIATSITWTRFGGFGGLASFAQGGTGGTQPNQWPTSQRLMCRVAAQANLTIASPGATIDGIAMAAGDRVLCVGQSTATQNGPWIWNGAAVQMTRPVDYPTGGTLQAFLDLEVPIREGAIAGGTTWRISTAGAITIDTTATTWVAYAQRGYDWDPLNFGCKGDGSTDDTAAMVTMLALAVPGTVIDFKSRTYALASASLAALPGGALKLPCSFLTLKGDRAVFTVTGTTPCGVFYSPGLSNIKFRGLVLAGNTQCSANTINNGTGIVFTGETAAADVYNLRVELCEFSGFMSQGAICFESLGTTFNLRKISVTGCQFVGGDVYQPTNNGTVTAAIYFGTNTAGNIYDILIGDNIIDATMMKSGIQFVGNSGSIYRALIKGNSISNVGSNYSSTIINSYAIACKPNCFKFTITGNIISGAVDCGIYAYSGGQFSISGNYIENVTSTDDSVLLRGAIVCNQPNSSVTGNSIVGCFFGIQAQGPAAGGIANITISGNSVQAQRPLTLKYNASATCSHISVVHNLFDATSGLGGGTQAIVFQDTGTFTLDNVTISDNDILGYIGIGDYSMVANGWNRMSILGNRITQLGSGSGIALLGSGWVDCSIERNQVYGSSTSGISIFMQGQAADINVSIVGNTVRNNTNPSARAYETGGTRGIFKDNQAINCTKIIYNGSSTGTLGLQIPIGTVGMVQGAFVQYIGDPQSGYNYGGVAGKILKGWSFDGSTWHPTYQDRDLLGFTVIWNPGSIGNGSFASKSITAAGAVLGDYVDVSAPYDLQGCSATAYVQSPGVVFITVLNNTGGTITLASGTWNIRVTPFT